MRRPVPRRVPPPGVIAVALVLLLAGCRTTRPAGAPFPPLASSDGEQAWRELLDRAAHFTGARSLMRMRVTAGGQTRSFRALLTVSDRQNMELTVYTPIGTTAATVRALGDRVTVEGEGTKYQGAASQLLASYGFYTGDLTPAEMGMLLIGLPPRETMPVGVVPAGIASVRYPDLTVTFEPASFPARKVTIEHGDDHVEVENLEVVALR